MDPETIDITVEGGRLTVAGSRSLATQEDKGGFHRKEIFEGSFTRTILLPEGIDPESVTATSDNGILEIVVPKRPEVVPKTIAVEVKK